MTVTEKEAAVALLQQSEPQEVGGVGETRRCSPERVPERSIGLVELVESERRAAAVEMRERCISKARQWFIAMGLNGGKTHFQRLEEELRSLFLPFKSEPTAIERILRDARNAVLEEAARVAEYNDLDNIASRLRSMKEIHE